MTAPVLKPSQDYILSIIDGPNKGLAFRLKGGEVFIGRAPENDIVLDDTKVSRQHLKIESRGAEFWAVDLGSQKGFLVNKVLKNEHHIQWGDLIQIGDTLLSFGPKNISAKPTLKPKTPPQERKIEFPVQPQTPVSHTQQKQLMPIFFILGALMFGLAFFMSTSPKLKKKAFTINDELAVSEQVENVDKMNEITQFEILKKGKNTQQYGEAQAFYLQGFREFREGNYTRAIHNFETALTLYPEHPLAKRYLARSKLKLNQEITGALERGEKNFQTKRYMQAFGEYRTVLMLTGDINNKNAQLAQRRIEAINLILVNSR